LAEGSEILWLALWPRGRAKAIQGEDEHPVIAPRKRAEILQLRDDPYLSAALAAEMLKHDGAKISEHLGRSLTAGETYLIHFLGPEDAERFMTKLDAEPQASAARCCQSQQGPTRRYFMSDWAADEGSLGQRSARSLRAHDGQSRQPLSGCRNPTAPEAQAYAEPTR